MSKSDPLSRSDYAPLAAAEKLSSAFFWIAAVLAIVALWIDKTQVPYYDIVQTIFVLSVVIFFATDLAVRLYWGPRAHAKRNADFLSNSFGVPLVEKQSEGYFNNDEKSSFRRIAFSTLENALFSKNILRKMVSQTRLVTAGYVIAWLIAILNRSTDLALVTTVAQVVFSEQVIARWARTEWLYGRVERIYDDTYGLIQVSANAPSREFQARSIYSFVRYECSKAQAGISLNSAVFKKLNTTLSARWDEIRKSLAQ